ncbi:leukocyte elastase inhibitor-like [Battus philenor]|uniref:leukocyte elastase inhibitor-like n=1 Tax=Battus philenor TaxID=42288 RepID=UPI0035D04458
MQIVLYLSFMVLSQYIRAETVTQQLSDTNIDKERITILNSLNEFGFKILLRMMKQYPDENVIISPASISCLLAMTLLGSVGRTYDELAATLGFSEDILINRQNHEFFGDLLQQINSNDSWSKTMFTDAVFVDKRSQLREAYQSYMHKVYKSEVRNVDFIENVRVKEIINAWVSEQTKGMINNFLKEPLPKDTKIVLISALYFSGQWEKPFIPEHTRKMPFRLGKDKFDVDLMLNVGQFNYIFSPKDELHMIAFPYNDSVNTMYVLKPRLPEDITLTDLMARLDYTKIDNLINKMTREDAVVRFPKMEIKSDVNLELPLKELGVKSMFNPSESNFALMLDTNTNVNKTEEDLITKISDGDMDGGSLKRVLNSLINPGVYVDSVLHKVKMKIDEYGTEAVAATSGILARSSEQFYADSPFFMFIRNEKTKLITFSAVVNNPII